MVEILDMVSELRTNIRFGFPNLWFSSDARRDWTSRCRRATCIWLGGGEGARRSAGPAAASWSVWGAGRTPRRRTRSAGCVRAWVTRCTAAGTPSAPAIIGAPTPAPPRETAAEGARIARDRCALTQPQYEYNTL